jgi:hypothetical protein
LNWATDTEEPADPEELADEEVAEPDWRSCSQMYFLSTARALAARIARAEAEKLLALLLALPADVLPELLLELLPT